VKLLIATLVVLVGAVALGLVLREDPGYVLLGWDGWTLETTLAVLAAASLALFVVGYFVVRLVVRLGHTPAGLRAWRQARRTERARDALNRGLILLSEGNWNAAERSLTRHVEDSDSPLLNYLAAARAAQAQGAHERRDRYLRLAHQALPEADVAIGLTQAELQIAHRQMEQALATLTHLRSVAPQHVYVLRMLARLYERLADWTHLRELLPALARRKALGSEELEALERRVYRALLRDAGARQDREALGRLWSELPKRLAQDPDLTLAYAGELHRLGEEGEDEAASVLRNTLKRHWDERLVRLYGLIRASDAGGQLAAAEGWLGEHDRNPVLLQALGRLALRNGLWGKARGYLEASLGVRPEVATCRLLGGLLERLGETQAAMDCYRRGVALAVPAGEAGVDDLPDAAAWRVASSE